jgi:CheY-like chemotaxis protein
MNRRPQKIWTGVKGMASTIASLKEAAILMVEDDRSIAEMYSLTLRMAGHRVVVAGDGAAAFALASQAHFDLVLMDVHLPRVDGLEALRRIRSHPPTRELPVVMFTNSENEVLRRRAWAIGIRDWVDKSTTTPSELVRSIGGWLSPPVTSARLAPVHLEVG